MESLANLEQEIYTKCSIDERLQRFLEKNTRVLRALPIADQKDFSKDLIRGLQERIFALLVKNISGMHNSIANNKENQMEVLIKGLEEMIKSYFENHASVLLHDLITKNQENQKEIIIKCSLEEMVKAFFEDYVIVWHDPNVNNQENQQYIAQLKKFCKVFRFTEWQEAKDFLEKAQASCHVITSGTNGELLIKEIFMNQNVENIYIFCQDKDFHSSWAKNYSKISCVETDIQNLVNKIQENLLEWYKKRSSLKLNLPAFAPIFNESDKSQMNHLHRSLKVLPNFQNRLQAKDDFLALSKMIYQDKKNTKLIVEFEQDYQKYDKEQILKWYTKESFLYKVTNNCLRIATSDSVQYCRLLLKDIERAIKEQYQFQSKNFNGLLHRGAYLSEEEWLSLKSNMNKEIEMHGFLSVSKEKSVGLKFIGVDPSKKVFITIIVPKGPNEEEQGFAEVEEFSQFPKEKEVLFNVRSRFTVLETEDDFVYSESSKCRHLVLLYGAQGFRKLIKEQNPFQEVPVPSFDDVFCARCKIESFDIPEKLLFVSITDPKKQMYYCKKCVEYGVGSFLCVQTTRKNPPIKIKGCLLMNSSQSKIPFYGYKCWKCQAKKQEYYFSCIDCCKRWCRNCFESTKDCREATHSILLENFPFSYWYEEMSLNESNHLKFQNGLIETNHNFQQAEMYFEGHEYEKAIEYYNLFIQENEAKGDYSCLASSYIRLGRVYYKQGESQKALECFLKSLDIEKSISGENSLQIALSYSHIGLFYNDRGEYKKALEFCLKGLDIEKSVYGDNHSKVALSYNNLGEIYSNQGEYRKALEYYLRCLDIYKSVHEDDHSWIARSYNNIGRGYHKIGEYKKAFEYLLKSLEIRKSIYGDNHPDVGISYSNIGNLFLAQGEYKKALEYHLKFLNIYKSLHGDNHPLVATSYHNVGTAYSAQGENKKALEYLLKSLNIRKSIYGDNHSEVAISYNNLGNIFHLQGKHKKALEYYLKSLDIHKSIYGNSHPLIATSSHNIGSIYLNNGEYEKALEYFLKSLEIKKSIYRDDHAEIAISYESIGVLFDNQGEYKKALEYYSKYLDITKSVSVDHPNTRKIQMRIFAIILLSKNKQQ